VWVLVVDELCVPCGGGGTYASAWGQKGVPSFNNMSKLVGQLWFVHARVQRMFERSDFEVVVMEWGSLHFSVAQSWNGM
jgi:hypothetical protein